MSNNLFFFQAEDGIRDDLVTGVQTCALPIYTPWSMPITDTAGNNRMMKGYLDTSNTSTTTVSVSGLTSPYSVYVYCDGDNGSATKTGRYTIGSTTITAADNANTNFSGTFTQANNSAGNYVVFTNQTASSFTLTATGTSTDSGPRAPINGIQVIPTPPAAPTGLTATAVSSSQINLSWTASSGAASYNVLRSTTNGGPYSSVATGVASTSYSDSGLAASTTYYYVVQAVNSIGTGVNSAQANATTQAPPTPVAAPTFSPAAGTYTSAQSVTISSTTSGAAIRYTTDGSTPTSTTGTVYTSAVSIGSTTTLKAIAYKSGMTDSAVTSGTYTITPPSAATISINFQGGSTTNGTPALMASSESAGVVAATNWNNATGASGSLSSLKNINGVTTGASVGWSSNNIWRTPITDTAGNNRMLKGHL